MNNEVWSKISQFLKELRCEDIGRNTYLELPEYKEAMKKKALFQKSYESIADGLDRDEKKKLQEYVSAIENCAEEECQQSYMQGIIDTMLMMQALGFLPSSAKIEELVQQMI